MPEINQGRRENRDLVHRRGLTLTGLRLARRRRRVNRSEPASVLRKRGPQFIWLLAASLLMACGAESRPSDSAQQSQSPETPTAVSVSVPVPTAAASPAASPSAKATQALVLSLARFPVFQPGKPPVPFPAALEFLVPSEQGMWEVVAIEDPQSNVFHKAMSFPEQSGEARLLTVSGSEATVKTWKNRDGDLVATHVWQQDFGGRSSRIRDVEIADLYGDGRQALAVATHDQGVVAILRPTADGGFSAEEIDRQPDTFVHEIEIGDLDGDGVPEVYATPSEPNRLDGSKQKGTVVRYVPAKGEGRFVVADLGRRHAKEILVDDIDGDGRDELYVAIEGEIDKRTQQLEKQVEIRRYEADTAPTAGILVAKIPDRFVRFLTVGDIEGDGRKEMVVAGFVSGLWLLRPQSGGAWKIESIDRNSGGFEHASILADLDEDGRDELYVASDTEKLVRRYEWDGKRLVGRVIRRRKEPGDVFTWNLMPVPIGLVPR